MATSATSQVLAQREQIILLERYLTITDVLAMLFDWRVSGKYLFYDLFDKRFKATFHYDGLNIYHLIRRELRESYVGPGIINCLFLLKAFERLARKRPMKHVISFLEFYPQALAVYAGVKRGNPEITTVAYQHAAVTRMKLWYCSGLSEIAPAQSPGQWGIDTMPSPDVFLCQGSMGEKVILESGYPQDRCFLTGSPRYDHLGGDTKPIIDEINGRASLGIPQGKKVILVSTLYSPGDTSYLVRMVAEACSGTDDWFVIFKPHPNYPGENAVVEASRHFSHNNWAVLTNPVQQLIRISDVAVTTYSTTADEAIALGCPVVMVQSDASLSMSTLWEIEAAPAVGDAKELKSCLETLFQHPRSFDKYRKRWPELVEGTFYRLDGRAKERVTEVLLASPELGRS